MTVIATTTIRRVEEHMGTVITLVAHDADDRLADWFFDRIAELEALLSRSGPTQMFH